MTNKQIISEVVNDLRALQCDDHISERFILNKLRIYNSLLLKRENEQFRLYDDNNVWFPISCLQMEYITSSVVPDGSNSMVISKVRGYSRSISPLPQLYSSKAGPLVREVMSVDDGNSYQPTTPLEYARVLKREYQNKNIRYYWFDAQGRLILPQSMVEVVQFTGAFLEPWRATLVDSCASSTCPDPLNDRFLCPSHLLSTVKEMATKDLYSFYKRTITDPVPDGDNNSKQDSHRA